MIHIRLDKVTFSYPSKPVFSEASCEIQEGCYGVIGPNGSGKTTLLKLILQDLQPDSGFIGRDKRLNMAYMTQDISLDPDTAAFDIVRQGAARVLSLEAELIAIQRHFSDPAYYENEQRLTRLINQQEKSLTAFNQLGGPGLEGHIKTLLSSIGFQDHEMRLPVRHLSGGQKAWRGS